MIISIKLKGAFVMIKIIFSNQDYFTGMVEKRQKPFIATNVTDIAMFKKDRSDRNNMYIWEDNSEKASHRLYIPTYLFYNILGKFYACRNCKEDTIIEIRVNCSRWSVSMRKDTIPTNDLPSAA